MKRNRDKRQSFLKTYCWNIKFSYFCSSIINRNIAFNLRCDSLNDLLINDLFIKLDWQTLQAEDKMQNKIRPCAVAPT